QKAALFVLPAENLKAIILSLQVICQADPLIPAPVQVPATKWTIGRCDGFHVQSHGASLRPICRRTSCRLCRLKRVPCLPCCRPSCSRTPRLLRGIGHPVSALFRGS